MTPLDNLRRIVAGWRGEWRVDAHAGVTLSHDGEEWPIGALDGDATIVLVELLNAIRPAVDGATAEIARLTAELAAARGTVWHAIRRSGVRSGVEWIRWNVPSEDGPAAMMIRRDPGAAQWLCQWESDLLAGSDWDDFTFDDEAVDAPCEVLTVEFHSEAAGAWPKLTPILDATASQPATVGGLLATEADALLCRWYAAKQDAIGALVDLENLRRPDPDDSWAGGIGRRDPMPGAEKRAADTKERLVAITNKVIAAMTRGTAPAPATVGGLLAAAPVGAIVEWQDENDAWLRCVVGQRIASMWWEYPPKWTRPCYGIDLECIRFPARLVPAHLADADPATRGPIGEVPDAR